MRTAEGDYTIDPETQHIQHVRRELRRLDRAEEARRAGVRSESDLAASWIVLVSMGLAGLIVVGLWLAR